MTKYVLLHLTKQVSDPKYRGMKRFPLHEFSLSSADVDANPEVIAEYSDKEKAMKALGQHECIARRQEGFNYKFWEFSLYYVQEVEVDQDGEEDWSGGAYYADWEYPEWEKNEYCDYQYYFNDDDDDEEDEEDDDE